MQEKEIAELILSKEDEIFDRFDKQRPGESPEPLTLQGELKAKNQINLMLKLISNNSKLVQGYRRPTIEISTWGACKNNIKKCGYLNENWEICDILDIDSLFDSEEAQKNCFKFVTKALKNTIKSYSIILK